MSDRIPPPPSNFYKFLVYLLYLAATVLIVFKGAETKTSPVWAVLVLTFALFVTLLSMGAIHSEDKDGDQ